MPRTTSRAGATALLLHGEERFLVDEKARATLDAWRQELVSDFGLETLEGSGLTPARLQDAVLQAPFLDPYRVVFVRMLPANRAEGLAPALQQIPPTTRLLITVAGRIGATMAAARSISASRVDWSTRILTYSSLVRARSRNCSCSFQNAASPVLEGGLMSMLMIATSDLMPSKKHAT